MALSKASLLHCISLDPSRINQNAEVLGMNIGKVYRRAIVINVVHRIFALAPQNLNFVKSYFGEPELTETPSTLRAIVIIGALQFLFS
jgi:hypothetical protein